MNENDTPEFPDVTDPLEPAMPDRMYYAMVLAEVIFTDGLDETPKMGRTQFYSKSDSPEFPADRINHLQRVAAMNVRKMIPAEINIPNYEVADVHFLSLTSLGQFTEQEFWGNLPAQIEAIQTPEEVSSGETALADNVTPIRPS